jgi:hypothetical protein
MAHGGRGKKPWVTCGDGRTREVPANAARGSKPLLTLLPRPYHARIVTTQSPIGVAQGRQIGGERVGVGEACVIAKELQGDERRLERKLVRLNAVGHWHDGRSPELCRILGDEAIRRRGLPALR